MATYSTSISRDASNDPLVPEPFVAQVIQETIEASTVLSLAQRVTMSSKTRRQPVLSALPSAYFVDGDTGLKQTTSQDWANLSLVAEELAAIVVAPIAYIADSAVPVWDEVRPRLAEAFGAKIDLACLFGVDKPSTWGTAITDGTFAASNTVSVGAGDDVAQDIANLAKKVVLDGFSVNGFASAPGFQWTLVGLRSDDGVPIYTPSLSAATPAGLFGFPLRESRNGGWQPSDSTLILGDWSKAIVGIRQDLEITVHTDGVISDGNGVVVRNLMQQDSVAIRAVMRLGWQVANPITVLNGVEGTRFPFGQLVPAST